MKKWNIICKISVVILIIFIVVILCNFISAYNAKVNYPYPALGIDINNWFDRCCLKISFIIYIFGIPFIIDIILLIISIIKIVNGRKCCLFEFDQEKISTRMPDKKIQNYRK